MLSRQNQPCAQVEPKGKCSPSRNVKRNSRLSDPDKRMFALGVRFLASWWGLIRLFVCVCLSVYKTPNASQSFVHLVTYLLKKLTRSFLLLYTFFRRWSCFRWNNFETRLQHTKIKQSSSRRFCLFHRPPREICLWRGPVLTPRHHDGMLITQNLDVSDLVSPDTPNKASALLRRFWKCTTTLLRHMLIVCSWLLSFRLPFPSNWKWNWCEPIVVVMTQAISYEIPCLASYLQSNWKNIDLIFTNVFWTQVRNDFKRTRSRAGNSNSVAKNLNRDSSRCHDCPVGTRSFFWCRLWFWSYPRWNFLWYFKRYSYDNFVRSLLKKSNAFDIRLWLFFRHPFCKCTTQNLVFLVWALSQSCVAMIWLFALSIFIYLMRLA